MPQSRTLSIVKGINMSEIDTERPEFGVAMVGYAFMGAAHSRAWETVSRVFDLPVQPVRRVIVGRDVNAAGRAAWRLGWGEVTSDWRAVLERADIDVVDICTPGDSHAEIAVAALEAGKHVICEKPLASTLAEAEVMADAAAVARVRGIRSLVGFNYRRVPALALARQVIAEGRLGRIYQVRAAYLQDWAADPASPLTWRMQRARAGSGALGDLGSHVVDLAQFLVGEDLVGVSGLEQTFVSKRPLDGAEGGRLMSTTAPCSPVASAAAAWRRSRRLGSRSGARTACGSRSSAGREVSPLTWRP